jgi:hypothetical protein
MPKSTKKKPKRKADGFPLWLHPSGRWCRKIRKKFHYFGTDLDNALARCLKEQDYLLNGLPVPVVAGGALTCREIEPPVACYPTRTG